MKVLACLFVPVFWFPLPLSCVFSRCGNCFAFSATVLGVLVPSSRWFLRSFGVRCRLASAWLGSSRLAVVSPCFFWEVSCEGFLCCSFIVVRCAFGACLLGCLVSCCLVRRLVRWSFGFVCHGFGRWRGCRLGSIRALCALGGLGCVEGN